MGDQRLPEKQPHRVPRHKHVLKRKKKKQTFPPFMEGHYQQFFQEELDDSTGDYEPCEEILSRTSRRTFLPRISHEVSTIATKKSQGKVSKNLELFYSVSMEKQGSRRTQHKLDHLSQMKDDAEDYFTNFLQMSKDDQNLNKWPLLKNQTEANKNSKRGKHLHRKLDLGTPEKCKSCQKNFLPRVTSINQNLLDSLNYRYTQRGSDDINEWDEALENSDVLQQFDKDYAYQPTYEDSSDKKISHLPSKIKYLRGLSKEKDMNFSKQESKLEMKLQKSHDLSMSNKEKFEYGLLYQTPKQLKGVATEESLTNTNNLLEIQGKSVCEPDAFENLYSIIAFKDFIVYKGYDMPVILEKFFKKKGWNYNSVNTPIPTVLKEHEMKMQKTDDEDEENGGKEHDCKIFLSPHT
ncbi:putative protein FAM47D [Meriones unguiculatus]|uniref:putative protein FAM47D n=1 Tax=Meriones unguiculatus TaxID=10047 RepID=UPI000B4F89B7|nr:putative protein FAM47D [Meriones unguiculatus]